MVDLNENAKKHIELFYKAMPAMHKMSPQAVRELMAQSSSSQVELELLSKAEDRTIPVKDGEIKIRIYTPEGQGPFPIFVYFHGGGWVLGSIEVSNASLHLLANRSGCIVVSVDYRLAPEYKYPIPVEDSYAAVEWVSSHALDIKGNPSKIVVGGDSSGGNLAAVVSMMARDKKGPKISAQVLIYPVTSLDFNSNSYQEFQEGYVLEKELMIWFANHYIRNEADKKDKYVAPLLADDLSNLPPTLVITAEYDVLRDEGLAYAKRLKQSGVEVESICEQGLIHGYFTNVDLYLDRIKGSVAKIAQFLEKNI